MRQRHLIYNLRHIKALKSISEDTSYANSDSEEVKQQTQCSALDWLHTVNTT